MIAGRGRHELHVCEQVCQVLWGDPIFGVLGVVVVDVHHQAVRGDKAVGGALTALVFGGDMVETGCRFKARRVSDGGLVWVVGVGYQAAGGGGEQDEGGHG